MDSLVRNQGLHPYSAIDPKTTALEKIAYEEVQWTIKIGSGKPDKKAASITAEWKNYRLERKFNTADAEKMTPLEWVMYNQGAMIGDILARLRDKHWQ
jgi:hypothetical protein